MKIGWTKHESTQVIMKRFNEIFLEKLEIFLCVNDCEGFLGLKTKYSEGKRNCLNHTDLWRNMLLHVVNIISDPLNIHETYSSHLNIQK